MTNTNPKELATPIKMCDALSRNAPADLKTILANCLAHGRRQFVEVAERFPEECRHVPEAFAAVYRNDALAKERNLSPVERLLFDQTESGPIIEELHAWLPGSSTSGGWSRTRRWAEPSPIC